MFLASTRCGLIACRLLVKGYYENRYTTAPEIAERYNMNVRALMPALRQMTKFGILRSRVGGNRPGFIFSKPPSEITILEVLIALEGNNEMQCCKELILGLNCDCKSQKDCSIYKLFGDMVVDIKKKLEGISIEEHAKMSSLEFKT